jgi:hypothetical protein
MRLLKVELSRLFARRLFRAVVLLGLVGVLAVDGYIAARSSNTIAAAKARADQQLHEQYTSCLAQVSPASKDGPTKADCDGMTPAGQLASCLQLSAVNAGQGPTEADCRRNADYNPYFSDPRFHFADHAKDLLTASAYLFMAVGLVTAASAVGAEWQAGTFASLLTWEPRRQRVLAAKLLAPTLAMGVLTAVCAAVLEAGAALAAATRGTLDLTTGRLVEQVVVMGLRIVGLVMLVTLISGAIAAFTRHTVAVVGVVLGYLVAGELVGGIVSPWWRDHGLVPHLLAFVNGKVLYYAVPPRGVDPNTWHGERYLHAGAAALIVAAVAVVAVAVASVTMSRRDVT